MALEESQSLLLEMIVGRSRPFLQWLRPLLEKHLGQWKGTGAAPAQPEVTEVALPAKPRVFLVDQPGAIQSNVYAAQLVPPTGDAGTIDFDFANGVLGGQFSSRLNMNLREEKHWAYGSYSFVSGAKGQRPWMAYAAVQIDKTAESVAEIQREIAEFTSGKRGTDAAELARMQALERTEHLLGVARLETDAIVFKTQDPARTVLGR